MSGDSTESARDESSITVGYLDKVRRLYPQGIPASVIVAPPPSASSSARRECLFLIVRESADLPQDLSELLGAICAKAIMIPRELCEVKVLAKSEATDDGCRQLVSSVAAPLMIVLGSNIEAGTIESVGEGRVLYSHSLDGIATDLTIKRDFWSHLKAVVARR